MSETLDRWNQSSAQEAAQKILSCCGSTAWARELAARRPFRDEASLIAASDDIWRKLPACDWLEAFAKHPRIGERKAPLIASTQSASWSAQEQQLVATAAESVQSAVAEANLDYERRFGRVFILCATGKSAPDVLDALNHRLRNDEAAELQEAAEEQRKITNLRLKKWLSL